jgi:acyl-homoserine-lactone acylase
MRNLFVLILLIPFQLFSQQFSKNEIEDLKSKASNVTIIRDIYGVPHVYGKTDADAVFGLLYAQSEENFPV